MHAKNKRVAIIGAGLSGIATAKTFKEEGFDVTVYEKSDNIGGLYYTTQRKETDLTSSKFITSFSDFPMPDDYPYWINFEQMYQYLYEYAKKFNLFELIKFKTDIIKIEANNNYTTWKIKYQINKNIIIEYFDYVVIASGINVFPNIPEVKNLLLVSISYLYKLKPIAIVIKTKTAATILCKISSVNKTSMLSMIL